MSVRGEEEEEGQYFLCRIFRTSCRPPIIDAVVYRPLINRVVILSSLPPDDENDLPEESPYNCSNNV